MIVVIGGVEGKSINDILINEHELILVHNIIFPKYLIKYDSNTTDEVKNMPSDQVKFWNENIKLSSEGPKREKYIIDTKKFITANTLNINTIIISTVTIIAKLTGSEVCSYGATCTRGFMGWFYSANEIGIICVLLYAVTLYIFFETKFSVLNVWNFTASTPDSTATSISFFASSTEPL